ncbi:hypothetical protein [Mammaliicoccus sciuri]|uniref:hypothetical protein n=1 Tax=Mammaliicoccus sciuri TaxID=1296 RepID=UPI000878D928|nr:hypothetical protein [Mammaliicoccus sciuri]MBG9204778.1 hypothetical protein [Mammaliicoccus sciuri]MEB7050085.1 hypothetical protein [Mammaliicoccus sciuri]WQJ43257.1 hypothetical protein P3T99_05785 [Mammaliicoccus sciuri]
MKFEDWQYRILYTRGYGSRINNMSDMEYNSLHIARDAAEDIIDKAENYEDIIKEVKPLILPIEHEENEDIKKQIKVSNRIYENLYYLSGGEFNENN